ncbi:MAG: phytanoyl-CoA dioxygenase family protein, partial [Chloroflexi bacterium]|nr:phytanoyl-CoA dioxygenase family protein [Chloroflexota bacterium]
YSTEIDESKAVDVVCPGGTVVLFSANLLHGTNDNESDAATGRSRYSTAWHYLRPDTDIPPYSSGSYADWHVLS